MLDFFYMFTFKSKEKNIYDIIRTNIYNTEKEASSRCILEFSSSVMHP